MTRDTVQQQSDDVLDFLEEKGRNGRDQVARSIDINGIEFCWKVAMWAVNVHRRGTVFTHDKKRLATPGGLFLKAIKKSCKSVEDRQYIFGHGKGRRKKVPRKVAAPPA